MIAWIAAVGVVGLRTWNVCSAQPPRQLKHKNTNIIIKNEYEQIIHHIHLFCRKFVFFFVFVLF